MTDCLIIGAGPAGLAAAIAAARAGRGVVVIEKNDRPGRKLLLTGGGRCNLVDPSRPALDALGEFGRGGEFLRDALARFDLAEFLAGLGVATQPDLADGRHYVVGGARKLLGAMLAALERAGAQIVTGAKVKSVRLAAHGFEVSFPSPLEGEGQGEGACAKHLIVAAGGMTYPGTGSSGDGYAWAESLGHRIDPPRPALAGLTTTPCFGGLAGSTVADSALTLTVAGKKAGARRGTILFTHRGISGPAAIDLSLDYARVSSYVAHPPSGESSSPSSLQPHQTHPRAGVPHSQAELTIDFLPGVPREEVDAAIAARPGRRIARAFEDASFAGALPSRLIAELIHRSGIEPAAFVDHVSSARRRAFADALKSTRLAVSGLEDPAAAVVTFGGVSTRRINPRTMESRLVPGLFFAGEIVSIHGPCGGFNLLQALATGWLAGASVTSDE